MSVILALEVAFCIAQPPTPKSGSPSEKRKAGDGTTPPPKKLELSKPLKNTRQVDEWKTDTAGLRKLRGDMQNVHLFSTTPRCPQLICHASIDQRLRLGRTNSAQWPPHCSVVCQKGFPASSESPLSYQHKAGSFTNTHHHQPPNHLLQQPVAGGNTSDNGFTVEAKRILQSRPRPEVTTGPPPVSPAKGNSVAPTPSSPLLLQPAQAPKLPQPNPIFLAAIKDALAWHPPTRSKPVFKFKLTKLTARTNLKILEWYNYDLQAILLEDAHSPLCPGSEFAPPPSLIPNYRATLCGREPRRH
jgi:hypothetical protein